MSKGQRTPEKCRICGKTEVLTKEHIIPRAAGGGVKTKLYDGDNIIKATVRDRNSGDKPYGKIHQDGWSSYTLCKSCNSLLGTAYDTDFANFYNGFSYKIFELIRNEMPNVPNGVTLDNFLVGHGTDLEATIKPMNVAKRVLASFCSVTHPGLTDEIPEIRKAILDKNYKPSTDSFAIHLKLHVGSYSAYGDIARLLVIDGKSIIQAFSGIEMGPPAFYLTKNKEWLHDDCVDITNWLTDYAYDEECNMKMALNFQKPLFLNIPPEAYL